MRIGIAVRAVTCWVAALAVMTSLVYSQDSSAAAMTVTAEVHPSNSESQVIVRWQEPVDGGVDSDNPSITSYEIQRRIAGSGAFSRVGQVGPQDSEYNDSAVERGVSYEYQVIALADDEPAATATTRVPVTPQRQWFRTDRGWLGIIILIVCLSVVAFIIAARSGRELYVRKIPGLEAVDEAVGRATEMGRPCLFVPGIQDINDIQTVAGLTVLSRVSSLTAEYGSTLEVPTSRSLVMTTARETVSASYLAAGCPDEYREDDIYYLTDEQFGYVASVTATMMEEKPAACFYMGAFFAESLILAETGNAVGAIQVAGTAQPSQLPFFVAACDYTLIGEEFFAASAYLSGEPVQLGSLRGQDIGKVLAGLLIVVGCGLATWAAISGTDSAVLAYVTENILGDGGFSPE